MSLTLKLRAALTIAVAFILLGGAWSVSATGPLMTQTVAGGFANNGGTATATTMDHPQGVAVSGSNVYVVDSKDCLVRKIAGSTVTTIAGNGGCGYGGDGGAATSASLRGPQSVAVDNSGNVYIADTGNCRIRKVTGTTISTVAGSGACFSSGDGGSATAAGLALPYGIAVDAFQNLFIADAGGCRIREVTAGNISTVAGNGTCGYAGDGGAATAANLNFPQGITVDGSGNLYIADTNNCMVRKVSAGTITLLAGHVVISGGIPIGSCAFDGNGLTANVSALFNPAGITVSGSLVYIADTGNCLVRTVAVGGGTLDTFAGSGSCGFAGDSGAPTAAQLSSPTGVGVGSGGNVDIADSENCRVRQVASGVITTIGGNGTCGYAGDGGATRYSVLHGPAGIAVTAAGDALYIADTANCRVRKVAATIITTFAGNGTCGYGGDNAAPASAQLNKPQGLALDSATGNLYIADTENCRVRKVAGATISTYVGTGVCGYAGDSGVAGSAKIGAATGLGVSGGSLYISDTANCVVRKVNLTTNIITTVAGNGTCGFSGDGAAATSAMLYYPHGIAFDSSGNVYIADTANCVIRKITGTTISTVAGVYSTSPCTYGGDGGPATSAHLKAPQGVKFDASNNMYIADTGNCRVREVIGSTISTFAGTGTCTFGGDFGAPASAALNSPYGLAIDSAGDIFIADTENNRVRVVSGDADGDTLGSAAEIIAYGTNPAVADTDNDGCGDGKEWPNALDPLNQWDFYSVPVPALLLHASSTRDNGIGITSDVVALLAYSNKKPGNIEYDQDLDGNGVADGIQYDRSKLPMNGRLYAGPPDNGIGITTDVVVMLSWLRTTC